MLHAQTSMKTIQHLPGMETMRGMYEEMLRQLEDQGHWDLILEWKLKWDSQAIQALYEANSIIAREITHDMDVQGNDDEPLNISLT